MTAFWEVREGDALRLREMPDASVQCCVTSPPYFGLRDYGTGEWEGGEDGCDHRATNYDRGERADRGNAMERTTPYRDTCGKCGARRTDRQLGLEATPDEYVAKLVEVFGEVRRVLRDDGTLWLNIGDSYGSGTTGRNDTDRETPGGRGGSFGGGDRIATGQRSGVKPKDLLGIPWLLAFALRADGWYLRSDIIWAKPNPMPESVTDRPTSAHEHVFLLSKSARYMYDADAIREDASTFGRQGSERDDTGAKNGSIDPHWHRAPLDRYEIPGRNRRNVWEIATQPYAEAHFATFPCKLVEPCILAGSAEGDTILDPFAGAGTTGLVALRKGRSFVGVELNPTYAEMARERIRQDAPLLNTPAEAAA